MSGDETQFSLKPKRPVSVKKALVVKTNPKELLRLARTPNHRVSSRSWTGSSEPLEERYTTAEMLSLCVAIVLALGLLSLPIIFHFVQVKANQGHSDSNDTSVSTLSEGMEDYQQDGSAENEQFVVEPSVTQEMTCTDGFYIASNVCIPACDEWEQDSHQVTVAISTVLLVASLMSLVSGACVIIGSIIRHDSMFQFPSVLVVYMTVCYCVIELFNAIAHFDSLTGRRLFCSSRNLLDSFNQSTKFCILYGAVTQYFGISVALWWLFHIGWIYYKLNFALVLKAKLNITCIHVTLVILGILLPLSAVEVALFYEDYGYTALRVPPVSCISKSRSFIYYSFTLILNIIVMAGVSLMLPIIWTVYKYRRNKEADLRLSKPELKLLVVLCYFILLSVVILPYNSVSSANTEALSPSFQDYFSCESAGLPNNCSKSLYSQNMYEQLYVVVNVFLSFIPTVNLIYVINWKKAKQGVFHHLRNFRERSREWNLSRLLVTAAQADIVHGHELTMNAFKLAQVRV